MNLTINEKDYELYFGLDFIAYLNKKQHVKKGEYNIGRGLLNALVQIDEGDIAIFVELIMAATVTNEKQPTEEDVKKYIETDADIEWLTESFLEVFETANATKLVMKSLKQSQEAIMNASKKTKSA